MDQLLWIDMEMTGLDVEKERIIEVAAMVTDSNFKTIDTYESIVFQESHFLENMDEWNTKQHGQSGLTAKVPQAPRQDQVETELCQMVRRHFKEAAILAGNSIGQDRKFIDAYMPQLASLLHYRMLDVTAWKVVMEGKFGKTYEKQEGHRALADIQESLAELRYYLNFVKV